MGDHVSSSFVGRPSDLNSYFQYQEKFLGVVNLFDKTRVNCIRVRVMRETDCAHKSTRHGICKNKLSCPRISGGE